MPATEQLQVEVVSHEGRLWHGSASHVSFPATDGSIGVLPGRQPLLAGLVSGRVSVTTGDGIVNFDIDQGLASVDSDFITIVVEHASQM